VPTKGTASIDVVLVPVEMKSAQNGLRSIFLYGTRAEQEAVRTWTVVLDVYARDLVNNRAVSAQGQASIQFINPMVEEVAGP
jgi:hypothetical protein